MTEKDYQKSKIKLSTWKTLLSQERHRFKYFAIIIACGMALGVLDLCASLLNMRAIDDTSPWGPLKALAVTQPLSSLCNWVLLFWLSDSVPRQDDWKVT